MDNNNCFVNIIAVSDVGKIRTHQEDSYLILDSDECVLNKPMDNVISKNIGSSGLFFAIADGMGGAEAGEIASKLALDGVLNYFDDSLKDDFYLSENIVLERCIWKANQTIVKFKEGQKELLNTGTTLVLGWLKSNMLHIAWIGDSRCYLYQNNKLSLLTTDHSYVQHLVDTGIITEDEAENHPKKNIITQSLGSVSSYNSIGYVKHELQVKDRFFLCSDGLNAMLNHLKIEKTISEEKNLHLVAKQLITNANDVGGYDNISIVAMDIINCNFKLKTVKINQKSSKSKTSKEHSNIFSSILFPILLLVFTGIFLSYKHFKDKENIAKLEAFKAAEIKRDSTVKVAKIISDSIEKERLKVLQAKKDSLEQYKASAIPNLNENPCKLTLVISGNKSKALEIEKQIKKEDPTLKTKVIASKNKKTIIEIFPIWEKDAKYLKETDSLFFDGKITYPNKNDN